MLLYYSSIGAVQIGDDHIQAPQMLMQNELMRHGGNKKDFHNKHWSNDKIKQRVSYEKQDINDIKK